MSEHEEQDNSGELKAEREIDLLQYKGNDFPRVLRFAWTALIIFSIFYLIKYMLPDLIYWISR